MKIWWVLYIWFIAVGAWTAIAVTFLIGHYRFSPEEALLPLFVQHTFLIIFGLLMTVVLPRVGGWNGLNYGLLLECGNFILRGQGRVGVYMSAIGGAIVTAAGVPGFVMISAARVPQHQQTRNQANFAIAGLFGAMVGVVGVTKMYDATDGVCKT